MAIALICFPCQALTLRSSSNGILLYASCVSPDSSFLLIWTHSVSTRLISEKYEVKSDGCICLQEMIFDHDGPGLPSYPEENTSWMLDSGMVRVAGYRSCWNRLNLGISSSGLELRTARGRIDLVKRIGPDRLISLSVEQLPSFVMLSCSFSGFGSDGQI